MTDLADLKQQLVDLTKWRAFVVADAEATIRETNRAYDEEATRLNRAIRRLEPKPERNITDPLTSTKTAVEITRKKKTVKFSLDGMEDWSPEEIEHYKRLKGVTV